MDEVVVTMIYFSMTNDLIYFCFFLFLIDPFFVSYLVERKVDDNGGYSYSEFLVHIHRQVPIKNEKDCVTSD